MSSLRQKGIGPPLLVYNGVSVSLLTRHCAVFLDQCHGKCVNDLVLEIKIIFPSIPVQTESLYHVSYSVFFSLWLSL